MPALVAPSQQAVDAFHKAALAHGGTDEGVPGLRPYGPGFYAAYVRDPDGNKLSAVHQSAPCRVGHASKRIAFCQILPPEAPPSPPRQWQQDLSPAAPSAGARCPQGRPPVPQDPATPVRPAPLPPR